MSNFLLEGHKITKEWLNEILYVEYRVRPNIIKVEPLSDVLGYMSVIVRVKLEWNSRDENLPQSVIAKIPCVNNAEDTWNSMGQTNLTSGDTYIKIMHSVETETYEMFKKCPCEGLAVPRFFGSLPVESGKPIILMEDFDQCRLVDLVNGFTEKELYSIVDQLTALHVYSFTHSEWRSLGFKIEAKSPEVRDFTAMVISMNQKLLEEHSDMKNCLTVLHDRVLENELWYEAYMDRYQAEGILSVCTHGDLWAPQILWNNGCIRGIVDWALCHPGSLTEDLLRVLVTSCNVPMRKRYTSSLLQYYYNQVETKLSNKGMTIPFSFDMLLDDYKRTLPFTCAQTTFATAMWSHSSVLRKEGNDDEERIKEMTRRLKSIVEETINSYAWI